jgi:hypothetical protein
MHHTEHDNDDDSAPALEASLWPHGLCQAQAKMVVAMRHFSGASFHRRSSESPCSTGEVERARHPFEVLNHSLDHGIDYIRAGEGEPMEDGCGNRNRKVHGKPEFRSFYSTAMQSMQTAGDGDWRGPSGNGFNVGFSRRNPFFALFSSVPMISCVPLKPLKCTSATTEKAASIEIF